jgi:site-specific DNA-cytosine methylase
MKKKLIILSLFDGISCGQLALQRLGIEYHKYYASEIDSNAIKVTMKHFPNTIQVGDICNLDPKDFKDVNVIIGGSPCQSISRMGKVKGITTKDGIVINSLDHYMKLKTQHKEFNHSALFWEFVRLYRGIKKYNPDVLFLLENVINKNWSNLITREIGVAPISINSSLVSAQNRERNYWTNITCSPIKDQGITLVDVIPDAFIASGRRGRKINKTDDFYVTRTTYRKDGKSNCITCAPTMTGRYVTYDGEDKAFDPEQTELLQTIDAGYTNVDGLCKTKRYKTIGNAWTIDVITHFFENIKILKSRKSETLQSNFVLLLQSNVKRVI